MTDTKEQAMAKDNLIFLCEVGSRMYGTDTPESDIDMAGIFIPDPEYVLGLRRCEQVEWKSNPSHSGRRNTSEDSDKVFYSLPKFIHLAMGCNPNILELFFNSKYEFPPWGTKYAGRLLHSRHLFLSQKIRNTFLGYAHGQRQKLVTKKDRMDAIRIAREKVKDVVPPSHMLEERVLEHPLTVQGQDGSFYHVFEKGTNCFNVVKKLDDMEQEYGLRTRSIEEFGYDTKFAMHLIRILLEGTWLLSGNMFQFPIKGKALDTLKEIRAGYWPLKRVIDYADYLRVEAEDITSPLPEGPDVDAIEKLQMELFEDFWTEPAYKERRKA